MKQIISFTSAPRQSWQIILDDGSAIDFTMWFCDNQKGWFYSLIYGTFSVSNRRLVTSPNMLRQFREVIPFGLAILTTDGQEPVLIDDFANGRASFYVLNADDVAAVEAQMVL